MDNTAISKYTLNRKWIFYFTAILFILSLIPLVYIARYSHPSADDFSYGNHTVHTWRETGSLSQTLLAAITGTRYVYNTWQGSFTAVFFMTLHPGIFAENLYMTGIIILILGFVASTLFLLKVIFINYLEADKYSYGIIALLFTFISTQFIFCPVEGFYWYNSAMYYTGFHSISLILFSLTLLYMKDDNSHSKKIYAFAIPLLAFFVGGGNFVNALTSLLIMALALAHCVLFNREKRLALPLLLGTIAIGLALTIAVIAPGNAVRQLYFQSMNPILAIFRSFDYALSFVGLVISTPVWLLFACILPLIYVIARNSKFSFRYPVTAIALMYAVYASTFTPNLFSWSSFGPARVININFFSFLFFMLFSSIYACGSLARYVKNKKYKINLDAIAENSAIRGILVAAFILSCVYTGFNNVDSITSVSATRSLITGEASTYHKEYLARLELLQNPYIRDVKLPAFTVTPRVLFHVLDITSYYDVWPNTAIAQFYNKDSVVLVE